MERYTRLYCSGCTERHPDNFSYEMKKRWRKGERTVYCLRCTSGWHPKHIVHDGLDEEMIRNQERRRAGENPYSHTTSSEDDDEEEEEEQSDSFIDDRDTDEITESSSESEQQQRNNKKRRDDDSIFSSSDSDDNERTFRRLVKKKKLKLQCVACGHTPKMIFVEQYSMRLFCNEYCQYTFHMKNM